MKCYSGPWNLAPFHTASEYILFYFESMERKSNQGNDIPIKNLFFCIIHPRMLNRLIFGFDCCIALKNEIIWYFENLS